MGNSSAYAMIQWACARIGAILVTVNPAYRIDELITTLKLTSVSHLFVVPRIRTSSYLASLSAAISSLSSSSPHQIADPALPSLRSLLVVNNLPETEDFTKELTAVRAAVDFRDILVWDGPSLAPTSLQKDEVINIQFTSGTTGYPKGVCLTHSNLLNNALSIGDCMKLTPQDKLCNVPPLFHCFDECPHHFSHFFHILTADARLVLGNLAAWVYGSCIVYPSQIFNPVAIVDTLHDEKCTALHGVPTHFLGVLSEVQNRRRANIDVDLSSLRTGIAAGSPIPIELMRKLINEMNLRDLTIAYGMTETSPVSFQTRTTDTVVQRVETVGQASPHVQAKIIDPFSGSTSPVPVGVPGELCVAGYLLQKGYWNDIEQTQDVMKTHDDTTLWMHTGDQGVIDEEGYLRIVGRIKV
ncbi:acetyl-CoA synthetase-like protein [Sistotremastrum niveocremeum HHB9708]|uniref:Acetyl-CoA synthetase-like protein n=1 Tax=Sistotremastrum niveocremeum HHB9708 TaxID=1314777 RepID=A0A164YQT5_9AGAM|nr:acetyl-CoA synthetase-like protein [Sistotremastrum niveocremeum HHB9708]